jgi:hypothetical protein
MESSATFESIEVRKNVSSPLGKIESIPKRVVSIDAAIRRGLPRFRTPG